MREINKDLKFHFNSLEEKVNAYVREYEIQVERIDLDSNKENIRSKSDKQNMMLADIQELISEYKKKSKYDNVLTNMANPYLEGTLQSGR